MAKFSKSTDYGLILLTSLANKPGQIIPLSKLTREKNLPYNFLSQIAVSLAKTGFLKSKEGVGGGYSLNKKPRDIRISEVADLLEGSTSLISCSTGEDCQIYDSCSVRKPLNIVEEKVNQIFDSLTVADLM